MRTVPLGQIIRPARVLRAGGSDYPVLSMTMHDGLIDQAERFKKRIASSDLSSYRVALRGQLVVGFPIDEGVLDFQELHAAGIVSPAYGIWDLVDEDRVDRRYLKLALRSPKAFGYYRAKLRGSTARRRSLPTDVFLELPIPLPPLPEQRRIAAILDQADALRAKRRQVIAHLDALTRAAFVKSFGSPQDWPQHWPMTTIGGLAVAVDYGTSKKASETGEWPILRMGNVTDDGRLDTNDLKYIDLAPAEVPKYSVKRGDMLFNRTNSKEKVGKSAVVRTDLPFAIAGYLVRVRFEDSATAEFVAGYLSSTHGQAVRRRMAKAAVNQANINATEMCSIRVARPTTDAKAAYENALLAINRQRALTECALAADDELFTSLQSRAFDGRL